MTFDTILFPNLHLTLPRVGQSIRIGSFEIAFYGVIIAVAMLAGIYLAMWLAKRTGQDPDRYFNFAVIAMVLSIIGARIYYVLFSLDYYLAHPLEIFDLRGGGLAIYGGVIAGVAFAVWYCRRNRMDVRLFLDTAMPAVTLGQVIGRWGNFFNREVFGGYTDSLLAMALPVERLQADEVTQAMLANSFMRDGVTFVQVHPTFLYESLWNLALLFVMLFIIIGKQRPAGAVHEQYGQRHGQSAADKKGESAQADVGAAGKQTGRKKFHGEIFCIYLIGYGLGRFWIEGIRTDQLLIPATGVPVSQVVSLVILVTGIVLLAVGLRRAGDKEKVEWV